MGDKVVQGGKGLTTQAGIRVPFIANWPGHIKDGRQSDELIDAIDFLPTVLDVANAQVPDDFRADGESVLPILNGESQDRRDWVYMSYNPNPGAGKDHFHPAEFVMDANYKLYGDGRFYNIKEDVLETSTLSADSDEVIKVFTTRPDTLMGVTYVAVAAEHPLSQKMAQNNPQLQRYKCGCTTSHNSRPVNTKHHIVHRINPQ